MITLQGNFKRSFGLQELSERLVRRLTMDRSAAVSRPADFALLLEPASKAPEGCLSVAVEGSGCEPSGASTFIELPRDCDHVTAGDVVRFESAKQRFRILYRKNSDHNNFLVTERCDNYCLMCSQPPKSANDDWILEELFDVIRLLDEQTGGFGFTGGEPTLNDRFVELLKLCNDRLPDAAIHVLSNGRRFSAPSFAERWASIAHRDLMVGIPVYSDISSIHDHVVQADGAYNETIRGILNLKRLKQRVEIRVVLHQRTFERLPELARFITRNLLFVDHVALMGLEISGFTRANLDQLWIDPIDYQNELYDAVSTLDAFGIRTSIYNLQLCLLDKRLWKFAVKSISDWKREYFPQCADCSVRADCGGMFAAAKHRFSDHIRPL